MVIAKGIEKKRRPELLLLQALEELQHVFVTDDIVGNGRCPPKQIVNCRSVQLLLGAAQVLPPFCLVDENIRDLLAAKTHLVQSLFHERIDGRRDEQIKMADLGELPQELWRCEWRL